MGKVRVVLIGAGPGDPELITLKAKRFIEQADVLLYDYLVHPNIILMASHAKKICVGKKKGGHSTAQKDIHQLIDQYSKEVSLIVRLKGGDPMVFGRSGEEMTFLKERHIDFEIIPGVSSAIAVPTYAGIPLTHRQWARSVAFVTATQVNDVENLNVPLADTIVIMMGLLRLDILVNRLMQQLDGKTPIAVIESGTLAGEKIAIGTIDTILDIQKQQQLKPPALLVVGKVVNLHDQFNWRQALPLSGQRFVLCRAMHQQSTMRDMLFSAGADVLALPLNDIKTQIKSLQDVSIDKATHVIFTSENGVRFLFESLTRTQKDVRILSGKIVVAIGGHTAQVLKSHGVVPDMVPNDMSSDGILTLLSATINESHHILIPTSSEADTLLKEGLESCGATVEQVSVYQNNPPNDMDQFMQWVMPSDHLIFMNAALVHRFFSYDSNQAKTGKIFSIGPKTTVAIKQYTKMEIIESKTPSIDAMFDSILMISVRKKRE